MCDFCRHLQQQKTTVPRLSYDIIVVILYLAVSVKHRLVTDTDRQTDRHTRRYAAYTALARRRAVKTAFIHNVNCNK